MSDETTEPGIMDRAGEMWNGAMEGISGWIGEGHWKQPATWIGTILGVGAIGMLAKNMFKNGILGWMFGLGAALFAMPFLSTWLGNMFGVGENNDNQAQAQEQSGRSQQPSRDVNTIEMDEAGTYRGQDGADMFVRDASRAFSSVDATQAALLIDDVDLGLDGIRINNVNRDELTATTAQGILEQFNIEIVDEDVTGLTTPGIIESRSDGTMDIYIGMTTHTPTR